MAVRNEFLRRNARATRFGNLDLVPSAWTLASRVLPNSPLRATDKSVAVLANESLTISAKPVGVGAASQRLIPMGERSGYGREIDCKMPSDYS
jgi:hypothetical protein